MIERNSGGSVSWTYYDGNGSPLTSKSTEEQRYQIRSSVFGGQMISQVWGNGKKYRSYVRGIGNQTAVQTAYATSAATLNESVLFEYSDATSMSYRTTDKNTAAVAVGDGGEGSPIETDPLGGSVGTSTPYIEEPIIYEPDPGFPDLQPFSIDGPQMTGPDFWSLYQTFGSRIADLPGFGTNWGSHTELALQLWDESMRNGRLTGYYVPNEQLGGTPGSTLRIRTLTGGVDGGDYGEDGIPDTEDDNIYAEVEDTEMHCGSFFVVGRKLGGENGSLDSKYWHGGTDLSDFKRINSSSSTDPTTHCGFNQ